MGGINIKAIRRNASPSALEFWSWFSRRILVYTYFFLLHLSHTTWHHSSTPEIAKMQKVKHMSDYRRWSLHLFVLYSMWWLCSRLERMTKWVTFRSSNFYSHKSIVYCSRKRQNIHFQIYKYQLSMRNCTLIHCEEENMGSRSSWIWSDKVWQIQILIDTNWFWLSGDNIRSRIFWHSSLVVTFICKCSNWGIALWIKYSTSFQETHSLINERILMFEKQE